MIYSDHYFAVFNQLMYSDELQIFEMLCDSFRFLRHFEDRTRSGRWEITLYGILRIRIWSRSLRCCVTVFAFYDILRIECVLEGGK